MKTWQRLLLASCTDSFDVPETRAARDHQFALNYAALFWLTVITAIVSFWQDILASTRPGLSPVTILLLVGLNLINFLSQRQFKQQNIGYWLQLATPQDYAYWRHRVRLRLLFELSSNIVIFTSIFGMLWLAPNQSMPVSPFLPIPLLIAVCLAVVIRYRRLMARLNYQPHL